MPRRADAQAIKKAPHQPAGGGGGTGRVGNVWANDNRRHGANMMNAPYLGILKSIVVCSENWRRSAFGFIVKHGN